MYIKNKNYTIKYLKNVFYFVNILIRTKIKIKKYFDLDINGKYARKGINRK